MAFDIDHHWNSRKVSTVTDGFVPSDQDWQSWVWGGKRFGSTNRKRKTTVSKSSWSPSENIGGTDPKQTCPWFFFFPQKNTKDSIKYGLASPSPSERNEGRMPWMLFRSELSFKMGWGGAPLLTSSWSGRLGLLFSYFKWSFCILWKFLSWFSSCTGHFYH